MARPILTDEDDTDAAFGFLNTLGDCLHPNDLIRSRALKSLKLMTREERTENFKRCHAVADLIWRRKTGQPDIDPDQEMADALRLAIGG